MLTKSFSIADAEIEVNFQWDPGDPSVGIRPGWGEDTGAIVRAGSLQIHFLFEVEENKPVGEWPVGELQVCLRDAEGHLKLLADETVNEEMVRPPLSTVPHVCAAVERVWEQASAQGQIEWAKEDYWLIDAELEPEVAQQAKEHLEALQAAYDARYGEDPIQEVI